MSAVARRAKAEAIPINCYSRLDGFRKGSTHPAYDEERYRDIRHKVFAHKATADIPGISALRTSFRLRRFDGPSARSP